MEKIYLKIIKSLIIDQQPGNEEIIKQLLNSTNLKQYFIVYRDYKGDYTKQVEILICVEDVNDQELIINQSGYIPFVLGDKSKDFGMEMPDDIFKAWEKIWHLEDVGILEREYSLDFIKIDNTKTIFVKARKFSCG
ncbi:hypothetical protein EELLY_v1c05180 [Entomoplasma ellychniae]|uniref:Integron-associated effector binding protein domain-containing protein n=1 Tax=Entomoplasma ellychniae TaxID=2114 RepID=A0A8E2QW89_9MOLU|nr:hypothetical protein [Entomoplasma ellychniae]PPE04837.1 hypothetical protein EELLY_v1c05180 [Entomoplasma ellychniae]